MPIPLSDVVVSKRDLEAEMRKFSDLGYAGGVGEDEEE